jgi:hypothetical protein
MPEILSRVTTMFAFTGSMFMTFLDYCDMVTEKMERVASISF